MHFENISPNSEEDNESCGMGLVTLANMEEEEEELKGSTSTTDNLAPPSPSEIFHTPRQTLPFNCMSFATSPATASPAFHPSSSTSSSPITASSRVGDVEFSDFRHPNGRQPMETPRDTHFVRNPVGEIDCLEPLPASQYSYFRNVSWTEDPAFCNEVYY